MSAANGKYPKVTGTSTLARPKFWPGMLLQHDDLEQLGTYTRDLSRLLFRSLFGCGVVCGLKVEPEDPKCGKVMVTVRAGVALNCAGDPVYVPKDQHLPLHEDCDPNVRQLWVLLCGTTKCCSPRTAMCPSGDEETSNVCTIERAAFEIRIVSKLPECICGLPDNTKSSCLPDSKCKCVDPDHALYKDHYDGKCGCTCGEDSECCCCDCVLLAKLTAQPDGKWKANHRVRRFVRPVLMCDPMGEEEIRPVVPPDEGEDDPDFVFAQVEQLEGKKKTKPTKPSAKQSAKGR